MRNKTKSNWKKNLLENLERLKKKLGNSGSVIDVGAGHGDTRSLFGDNWTWKGIDIEPSEYVQYGDAHDIKFDNDSFDLLITRATLHLLKNPFMAIQEMERVLRKGGYIIGTVAFLEHESCNSQFHMSRHGIKSLLEYGGFSDIEIFPSSSWTVITSINLFHIPYTGWYRSLKNYTYFGIRRSLIKFKMLFRKGDAKISAQNYLESDTARYTGSFIFIATKK